MCLHRDQNFYEISFGYLKDFLPHYFHYHYYLFRLLIVHDDDVKLMEILKKTKVYWILITSIYHLNVLMTHHLNNKIVYRLNYRIGEKYEPLESFSSTLG
jgi:hypothetical protein